MTIKVNTTDTVLDAYKLLPMAKVMEVLGCGQTKLYALIQEGALECRLLGGKRFVFRESLLNFIRELAPPARYAATDAMREHEKPRSAVPLNKPLRG